ncbi:hypothetical protein [Halorussus halobius]|uniref:hypothetical protein n=1 Tax=Halorussus halobius TaxID=1710537 RepID=UPI00109330FF|nr:hypothetical protein [Halorussus halobius]
MTDLSNLNNAPNNPKQNKTFLAFRPESVSWILEVPASPEEGKGDQMLSIIEEILVSFEDILLVTDVACRLESKDKPEETDSLQIVDSDGVTFQDLVSSIPKASWRITQISLSGESKIQLLDSEHSICIVSDNYISCTKGGILEKNPDKNPIEISVNQYEIFSSAPYQHDLQITTFTDIWFEDSNIGQTNQRKLATALGEIYSRLQISNVRTGSETNPPDQVWSPKQ